MFISATTGSFRQLDLEAACDKITELQFDKVELTFDENGSQLKPSEVAADPNRLYSQMREFTRLSPVAFQIVSHIEGDQFEGICMAAKLMRVAQITVASVPLGTPFNEELDRLKKLTAIGNAEGVRVSMMTTSGQLTQDAHTAAELCQSCKGLGVSLDPSHLELESSQNSNYDMLYDYTYHAYLRDSSPKQLQMPVGLGDMDFAKLITALARVNYNRLLSVDIDPELVSGETTIELEMRKLRMLLESLL